MLICRVILGGHVVLGRQVWNETLVIRGSLGDDSHLQAAWRLVGPIVQYCSVPWETLCTRVIGVRRGRRGEEREQDVESRAAKEGRDSGLQGN